ncbi:energy transducer TonB [Qipengyuania sp. JC766]|uniref:energy transducer TonB n=1 Tax=Qipengyuania sp. JC766 TaxID=3232139 RepID=UPI0034585B66
MAMASASLRWQDWLGLAVAVVAHLALALVWLLQSPMPEKPQEERISVSFADTVGFDDTSPDPAPDSRPAGASALEEQLIPPAEFVPPPPLPESEPIPRTDPAPAPRPTRSATPRSTSSPQPRNTPTSRRTSNPSPRQTSTSAPSRTQTPSRNPGRFDEAFNDGAGANPSSQNTSPPGRTFGAAEQRALSAEINRQLKPHWRAPQGVDTEKIVTVLSWRLNRDGSLAGSPRVVSQSGINDANRAQAKIHAENAIRAVQRAAPFRGLPDEFYSQWQNIRDWRFDRRL